MFQLAHIRRSAFRTVCLILLYLFLTQVSEARLAGFLSDSLSNEVKVAAITPRDDYLSMFAFKNVYHRAKNVVTAESGDQPSTSGELYLVSNRKSLQSRDAAKMFRSPANIIKLEDTQLIIYYDEDERKWYLHRFNKPNYDLLEDISGRIPVSWCLDMTDGKGGFISPSVEVELASGGGSNLAGGYAGVGQFKGDIFKVAFGVSLATSVRFTGGMTCNVGAGQYGQVFIRPYVFTVPEGERISIQFKMSKGIVEKGEWETTESYDRYWVRPPMVECAVSSDASLCKGFLPS